MAKVDRTAATIIDAAIATWARDPTASLGAVATSAGVGRTTLHRFHPDRATLIAAVDSEVRIRCGLAAERAQLDHGSAVEALHRLCSEFLALGDPLRLIFVDRTPIDPARWTQGPASHHRLTALFQRGQAEGSLDPQLDPEWMVLTTWLLLYGAWLVMQETDLAAEDAHTLLIRTLGGAVGIRSGS